MSNESMPIAATVLGTIGTVLWCIQLIPQIWHNWRAKECTGVPPLMFLLWSVAGVPFAVYFIVQQSNIPVQVQPHIFMVLSFITFIQALYYPPRSLSWWKLAPICIACPLVFAGAECGMIFPFKSLYADGVTWPTLLAGVVAAVLVAGGLIPPYFELAKRNGQVLGINFVFLTIDFLGALFSLLSLAAQHGELDILGCVLYAVLMALELGIFTSHIIWMVRFREQRKLDKQVDYDETDISQKNSTMELQTNT